jgi:hypothetical protein
MLTYKCYGILLPVSAATHYLQLWPFPLQRFFAASEYYGNFAPT